MTGEVCFVLPLNPLLKDKNTRYLFVLFDPGFGDDPARSGTAPFLCFHPIPEAAGPIPQSLCRDLGGHFSPPDGVNWENCPGKARRGSFCRKW